MFRCISAFAKDRHEGMRQPDLEDSCEEGCGVGEASQPVGDGVALINPAAQLVQPLQQVAGPGAQRLQAGVSLQPGGRHLHSSGAVRLAEMSHACQQYEEPEHRIWPVLPDQPMKVPGCV